MGLTEKYLKTDLRLAKSDLVVKEKLLKLKINRIIDFHTHYSCKGSLMEKDKEIWSNLISTYPYFEDEHHKMVNELFYSDGIRVEHVAFPIPMYGWNHKTDNAYISDLSKNNKEIWPFMMGVVEDPEYTIREITSGRWHGVKMYAKQIRPKAKKITDFFNHQILSAINEAGMIIMLHLPNDMIVDWPELSSLASQYGNISFVLAHFGLSRDCKDRKNELFDTFNKAKAFGNIYFDTAWFFESDILLHGLDILGPERILFASDQPINLVRCEFFNHPKYGNERVLVSTSYHWANKSEQTEYRKIFKGDISLVPSIQSKILKAIFDATENFSQDEECLKDIFFNNGFKLLSSVRNTPK
jgi:predicted TIM-barrel fold metal-dependent hydrolase